MILPTIVRITCGNTVTVHAQYRAPNGTVLGLYETAPGPYPMSGMLWLMIVPEKGYPFYHSYPPGDAQRGTALTEAAMIADAMGAEREDRND